MKKQKMKALLFVSVILFGSIWTGSMPVSAQTVSENDIAKTLYAGTDGAVVWSIDENGLLLLTGDGDYDDTPDWVKHYEAIKSATVKITNMTRTTEMFEGCYNMTEVTICEPDTWKLTDVSGMFVGCQELSKIDISGLDTSNVTDMSHMFRDCSKLKSVDVSHFNTSKVTNMAAMFSGCIKLESIDLSSFDTSNVTDMSSMFGTYIPPGYWGGYSGCRRLKSIDVSHFNTSKVTNMAAMFEDCQKLTSLDLSSFDTSNVTDMSEMFLNCRKLVSLNVSTFDTSNVTSMKEMFARCEELADIDVSSFDTSKVTDMNELFYMCKHVTELDFSMWDLSLLEQAPAMLYGMQNLVKVKVPQAGFDIWFPAMFYDENHVKTEKASANQGSMLYVLADYADSECGKNGHTYCVPVFIWSSDDSSAELYLECIREDCIYNVDDKCVRMSAIVTKETIQPTTEKAGAIIYTATAEHKGKTYTDEKRVEIPKLPAQNPEPSKEPAAQAVQPIGTTISATSTSYCVTKAGKTPEVAYMGPKDKKVKKVTIPATIKIDGVTYKVTSVGTGALKNYKNLTTVTVGKNVTKIGKNAFYGCKNLSKIVIKSKKLKSVGKNAMKGVKKNATIDLPNSKKNAYKKLFKAKTGYKKTMMIK